MPDRYCHTFSAFVWEDVRPVAVHEHAMLVVLVECVAGDVPPPVHHQHPQAARGGQPLPHHQPAKPSADDQHVIAVRVRHGGARIACGAT
jgi:hypothetical protein